MKIKLCSNVRFYLPLFAALMCGLRAQATITVLSYWHMGESDHGAVSGGSCTNTVDSTGGDTLAFTSVGGAYPDYTSGVAATASQDTGSGLGLTTTNGQYGTASLVTSATVNFGMECWVKPGVTNSSYGTQILAYNGLRGGGWGLCQAGTNFEGLFGGITFFGAGAATARAGTWTHLALVCNNGTTTLYTNGVPATTITSSIISPSTSFTVGGNALYGEFFEGSIDEVRVFTFAANQFSTNDLLLHQTPVYTLSVSNFNEGASAGTDTVSLTVTLTNVGWTAIPNVPWLHVTNGVGIGNATIGFTFDANPGSGNPSSPRVGTITIAGQTVTVNQSQPSYSLSGNYSGEWGALTMEVPNFHSTNSVSLTVSPNTGQWTCSATANWIHIITTSGTGSTNILFTVDPNIATNPAAVNFAYAGIEVFNATGSQVADVYVFQQAAPSGTGEKTYRFTGNLQAYLPQDVPANASTALKAVTNGDVFFLTLSLVDNSEYLYYDVWACSANYITFSVPAHGLVYTAPYEDFEVIHDGINPDTLRWDDNGVDSTVNMIFWARDFTFTALTATGSSVPDPLNLTGFHNGESFAQITLYDGEGGNPTLFYGNLVPMPILSIQQQHHTNSISWLTSDATSTPTLQTTYSLAPNPMWQTVTNVPASIGLTNIVTLPATNSAQFFRLQVL